MSGLTSSYFRPVEILVAILVLMSTTSLNFETKDEPKDFLEVESLKGQLNLDTRSSMDSLGLDDFRPGAVVELDIEAESITTSECDICSQDPIGVLLSGKVNVSNLKPLDSGTNVRIEGYLNVTHLQEFEGDMIVREWLTIDWDLAEFSTQWDIFIQHEPAKWSLENRYDASLVVTDDYTKSRIGPVIYVEEVLENSFNIHGCLPNTINCDGINREEINLTTTLTEPRTPRHIDFANQWIQYDYTGVNRSETNNLDNVKNLFVIQDSSENHNPYCMKGLEEIESIQSWEISGGGSSTISPMGLWLTSMGLPSSSFNPTNGIWTETDFSDNGCGAFTKDDKLILGISNLK